MPIEWAKNKYNNFDDGIAGDDTLQRMNKKKNFGSISFNWSFNREGVDNVLEGRIIALNDIWDREVHLKSFDWVDNLHIKEHMK